MVPDEISGQADLHERIPCESGVPHETAALGAEPSTVSAAAPPLVDGIAGDGQRLQDLERGTFLCAKAREATALRKAGLSYQAVAARLKLHYVQVHRLVKKAERLGPAGMHSSAFAPSVPGPKKKAHFLPDERAQIRSLNLQSNRTWNSGSAPEAVRRAIRDGFIRPELGANLLSREADGRPLLTESMRHEVRVGEAAVRAYRNPRDAWLEYVQSPGSMLLTIDQHDGTERYVHPGEAWTIDDGTINLVCCVPTGDPQYKFGVMPGRFQFLLIVDHRSYFIPGFSYTARPKSSYRAEDLLSTLHIGMSEHGAPPRLILERGVSSAGALTRMCHLAGIVIDRAKSPHQKMVEMVFNNLWTKLSFLPGQVGRYQGEEAKITAVLESCRAGAKDPRKHFPMLSDVLTALRNAIPEWNDHWVDGRGGRWQPSEYWQREAHQWMRPIAPQDAWMFHPYVTGPLKLRGMQISTSVLMSQGFSQIFTFEAGFAADLLGATVQIHFNPFAPCSLGKMVLVDDFAGMRGGLVLGDTMMIDRQARHTKRAWGYSDEEDVGREATRRSTQALHRSAVAIRPDGKPGVTAIEVRDGLGNATEFRTRTVTQTSQSQVPTGNDEMVCSGRVGQRPESGRWDLRAQESSRAREALAGRRAPAPVAECDDADLVGV